MLNRLLDTVTVLALIAVITIGGRMMWERWQQNAAQRDREIDGWQTLALDGHRMGPQDASVVILEWGDYQCPGCRSIAPVLDEIRAEYPNDVAIVYRHWPLTRHPFAFQAARGAECAAGQSMFEPVHAALNRESGWATSVEGDSITGLVKMAAAVGVPDTAAFRACVASGAPDARIHRDVEEVLALETRGTPTLIINGVYAASGLSPDAIRERVVEALESARGG